MTSKKNERVEALKAMHLLVCHLNDEAAYDSWIQVGVPDCPSDNDYDFIASDKESFEDCMSEFIHLVKAYGRSGFYFDQTDMEEESEQDLSFYTKEEVQRFIHDGEELYYFYPSVGERYIIRAKDVPAAIVDFSMNRGEGYDRIYVTDFMDRIVCTTCGMFLDQCDQEFRSNIICDLVNIQQSLEIPEYKLIREDCLNEI